MRRIDHAIGYFRQYIRDEQTPQGRFVPAEEPAQRALGEKNFRLLVGGRGHRGRGPRRHSPLRQGRARVSLGLPGYQVMRWSREDGVYRDPRHYPEVSLVTTGTHDTETLRGWWENTNDWEREMACRTWPELQRLPAARRRSGAPSCTRRCSRAAMNAQSQTCIFPWQDVFGEAERTNTPGTMGAHNWAYRMRPEVQQLATDEALQRTANWLTRLAHEGRRG